MRVWLKSVVKRRAVRLACLFLPIAPFLGGCISTNTPGDLAFVSVQAVDWRDQKEMPGPGASPILGMVNSHVLEQAGQSIEGGEKPHRPLLKVKFTSVTNLSRFAIDNSFPLANHTFFCDHPQKDVTLSFSYIFWQGNRLGQYENDVIQRYGGPPGRLITYYIFIDVAREPRLQDRPPQEGFDLRQKPENLCFVLASGNEWGRGYRSNTVVIPKEAIATALTHPGSIQNR